MKTRTHRFFVCCPPSSSWVTWEWVQIVYTFKYTYNPFWDQDVVGFKSSEQNELNTPEQPCHKSLCHQSGIITGFVSATKNVPFSSTTETKLTDHQDTSTKGTTNSRKDLEKVDANIHHYLLVSPSAQHRRNNIITAPSSSTTSSSPSVSSWSPSSCHRPCPHHQHHQQQQKLTTSSLFHFWQISTCASTKRDTQVYMEVCKY